MTKTEQILREAARLHKNGDLETMMLAITAATRRFEFTRADEAQAFRQFSRDNAEFETAFVAGLKIGK